MMVIPALYLQTLCCFRQLLHTISMNNCGVAGLQQVDVKVFDFLDEFIRHQKSGGSTAHKLGIPICGRKFILNSESDQDSIGRVSTKSETEASFGLNLRA